MKLRDIETSILKALGKVNTAGEGDVCIGMLIQASTEYKDRYGYVPEHWSKCMYIADKYMGILDDDYDRKELVGMTLKCLAELVEECRVKDQYIEIREATAMGTSVKRVPLKQAA